MNRTLGMAAAAAVLALLALSCTGSAGVCQTSYATCRADSSETPGYTCVCRYEYWVHPGVVR